MCCLGSLDMFKFPPANSCKEQLACLQALLVGLFGLRTLFCLLRHQAYNGLPLGQAIMVSYHGNSA